MMTHGDPEGRICLSHPHTNSVCFFSCSPLNGAYLNFEQGLRNFQIRCCDITTLVNAKALDVTITNWCWLNSALELAYNLYLSRASSALWLDHFLAKHVSAGPLFWPKMLF